MTTHVVPDVLRQAADYIDTHGWTRSRDVNDTDDGGLAFCANGALKMVLGGTVRIEPYIGNPIGIGHDGTPAVRQAASEALKAVHAALNAYFQTIGLEPARTVLGGMEFPTVMRFNDSFASDGAEVSKALRLAAEWVESHPTQTLSDVSALWPAFDLHEIESVPV